MCMPAHVRVLLPLAERQQPAAVDKHGRDAHAPRLHALRVRQGVGVRKSHVLDAVARVTHQRHDVPQVCLVPKLHVVRRDEHERRPDEGERRAQPEPEAVPGTQLADLHIQLGRGPRPLAAGAAAAARCADGTVGTQEARLVLLVVGRPLLAHGGRALLLGADLVSIAADEHRHGGSVVAAAAATTCAVAAAGGLKPVEQPQAEQQPLDHLSRRMARRGRGDHDHGEDAAVAQLHAVLSRASSRASGRVARSGRLGRL